MPAANNADQTVTVRLSKGERDRVVALTGQPFSRLVRYVVREIIKREEAKLAAEQRAGLRASADRRVELRDEVAAAVSDGADMSIADD